MDFKGIYEKDKFLMKSLEEQKEYFNVFDETFKKDKSTMPDKLNIFFKEAAKNNIPAIDYLGMIYFSDSYGIETNLYFATCLSLFASACGSKLATDRIRSLLQPAYEYVLGQVDKIALYDTYNLNDETCEYFLLCHIASVLIFELKLSLEDILDMRKDFSEYPDFLVLDLEDLRDSKLSNMVDYLGL